MSQLRSTTLRASILVLLVTALVGCGDDGPSGPDLTDVSGIWRGSLTYVDATPAGQCVADLFNVFVFPFDLAVELAISQNGSSIEATLTDTDSGAQIMRLLGTVFQGNRVELTAQFDCTGFVDPSPVECAGGDLRGLCLTAVGISTTVTGATMSGTHVEDWQTVDADTGMSTGDITVNAVLMLAR